MGANYSDPNKEVKGLEKINIEYKKGIQVNKGKPYSKFNPLTKMRNYSLDYLRNLEKIKTNDEVPNSQKVYFKESAWLLKWIKFRDEVLVKKLENSFYSLKTNYKAYKLYRQKFMTDSVSNTKQKKWNSNQKFNILVIMGIISGTFILNKVFFLIFKPPSWDELRDIQKKKLLNEQ